MGIPAFYRWLVERYPRMVADVVEATPPPADLSLPNPNGVEFDNLYLDMNGIIHPCFHPEGLPAPSSYEEVFVAVFKYIDKIFSIVRPRKLLFMAIDGVAPRAKMNQQRSRRFRAAKDAADEALLKERNGTGLVLQEGVEQPKMLDSNVITPGTEFMDLLSSALRYYVHLRMNENPGWRGIKVILSDASVPGEGEHKIMSYIRLQRNQPGFDPNTRHCLYGLDADLIMLALSTHEIHFTILREDTSKAGLHGNTLKNGKHHNSRGRKRKFGDSGMDAANNIEDHILQLKFQFLNISVLREYLAYDMRIPDSTLKQDLERLVDDFVFICMFVGNDFLPNIPSLEISEGAIDLLMMVYKKEFSQMGGYLTSSFEVNLERVEHFVQVLGSHESAIFRKRSQMEKERERQFSRFSKKKCSSLMLGTASISQDAQNIRLGEEGWNGRFYSEKFEAKTEEERERVRRHLVLKYVEGICWVMRYYYDGVCSWQWVIVDSIVFRIGSNIEPNKGLGSTVGLRLNRFYPYHYAPFASDFYAFCKSEIHFTLGEPFKPFDQLMGVLPAASAHALPLFYRKLMTDASSPILDFYPADFEVDMNGKRFAWQAICKLPFIDESRLLAEIAKVEHTLTVEERRRNRLGLNRLFVHASHPLAVMIIPFRNNDNIMSLQVEVKEKIDPTLSGGMNGYIWVSDIPVWPVEILSPLDRMSVIANNEVLSVLYDYPPHHPHIPRLAGGVIFPQKSVRKQDVLQPQRLWHETALCGHVSSRRPVHNSVSGPTLAKLAHQLVSKYISSRQQDGMCCLESGSHLFADGSEEMRINRKRKWKNDDGAANDGDLAGVVGEDHGKSLEARPKRRKKKSKKSKQSITGGSLNNSVEKTEGEGFVINEQRQAHREESKGAVISDGFPNNKVEKSDTCSSAEEPEGFVVKEHREAVREQSKSMVISPGFPNINVEKLDTCVSVKKSESLVVKEQSIGDGDCTGVDGENDNKTVEGKLKKRKKKSKKRKRSITGGFPNNCVERLDICSSVEKPDGQGFVKEQCEANREESDGAVISDGFPNDKVEKSDTCSRGEEPKGFVVKEQREAVREQSKGAVICDDFPYINVEKLYTCSSVEKPEGLVVKEQSKGDVDSACVDGENNSKTLEGRLKKRKRKSKKHKHSISGGFSNNSAQRPDICRSAEKPDGEGFIVKEQQEADREAYGFPSSNVEKLDTYSTVEEPESFAVKEQQEADREQSKKGVISDGFPYINAEKSYIFQSVEKPETFVVKEQQPANREQSKVDDDHASVVGDSNKTLEGKRKKRKKRSKKSKRSTTDGFLINSVEKLDICSSVEKPEGKAFVAKEQHVADREESKGAVISDGFPNNKVEKSDTYSSVEGPEGFVVKAQLEAVREQSETAVISDGFPNINVEKSCTYSSVEKLESFVIKEQNKGDGDCTGVNGENNSKTLGLKPRKRKKRSKKSKQITTDGFLINSVEKLDVCSSVEKPEGEAFIVKKQQEAVREESKGAVISDGFPGENVEKSDTCSSFEKPEDFIAKGQQEAARKQSKSVVISDGFPNNNVEKPDTCGSIEKQEISVVKEQQVAEQGQTKGDDECTGVDRENSKTLEAKSRKRKKRSKKSKQSSTDGFPINSIEKPDICNSIENLESFAVKEQKSGSEQSKGGGDSIGVDGENNNTTVAGDRTKQSISDNFVNNNFDKLDISSSIN